MNATAKPQDRVRGQLDVGLSPQGEAEADHLGRRIAAKGSIDSIVASPMTRAQQTVAAVLKHNPNAKLIGSPQAALPWDQGVLTGRPISEAQPVIQQAADHPNVPIPGGESVDQVDHRSGQFVHQQLHSLKPGERRLVLAHHSQMRFLHGWAKKNFPPDMSADPHEMATRADKAKPAGSLIRLAKKNGKPFLHENPIDSDEPIKPGLNFARHGATELNKESGGSRLAALSPKSKAPLS
jgi:broad specificity phosphatase PhoE